MHLNKVKMRFTMDQVHLSVLLLCTIIVGDMAPFRGSTRLVHLHTQMWQILFIAQQPCPMCVLILGTPRRYLSSCENGSDIVLYKSESQVCGFRIVPSY